MSKQVLIVGHCGIDGPRIEQFVRGLGCDAARPQGEEELTSALECGCDLILFNRELVGDFDEQEGIDLMRRLRDEYPGVRMMLVSDRTDAQREAEELGALKGFGKAELSSDPDRVGHVIRRAMA